ncbi:hypothetical protein [Leisingera caerulea]|uniref:hypothetical protein n=1 Tax=Leisingera caerulea TaxID=506591 RepID=UPI003F4AE745
MTAARPDNGLIHDRRDALEEVMAAAGASVEARCPACGYCDTRQADEVKADADEGPLSCGRCDFEPLVAVYRLPEGARLSFTEAQADHAEGDPADHQVVVWSSLQERPEKGNQPDCTQPCIPFFRSQIGKVIQGFARKCFQSAYSQIGRYVAAARRLK